MEGLAFYGILILKDEPVRKILFSFDLNGEKRCALIVSWKRKLGGNRDVRFRVPPEKKYFFFNLSKTDLRKILYNATDFPMVNPNFQSSFFSYRLRNLSSLKYSEVLFYKT